jgi:hypothetical protein
VNSPGDRSGPLFHYSGGQISEVTVVSTGAEIESVSAIPGTSEALASGIVLPNGTSVVYQYS